MSTVQTTWSKLTQRPLLLVPSALCIAMSWLLHPLVLLVSSTQSLMALSICVLAVALLALGWSLCLCALYGMLKEPELPTMNAVSTCIRAHIGDAIAGVLRLLILIALLATLTLLGVWITAVESAKSIGPSPSLQSIALQSYLRVPTAGIRASFWIGVIVGGLILLARLPFLLSSLTAAIAYSTTRRQSRDIAREHARSNFLGYIVLILLCAASLVLLSYGANLLFSWADHSQINDIPWFHFVDVLFLFPQSICLTLLLGSFWIPIQSLQPSTRHPSPLKSKKKQKRQA